MRMFLVMLLLPMTALAEGPAMGSEFWSKWAISSGLVIALIIVLGWLLRRLRGAALLGGSRQLKIVASLAVGQRERVLVMQVGEEQWLLGVTAQQISSLGKLEQPLVIEPAKGLLAKRQSQPVARKPNEP